MLSNSSSTQPGEICRFSYHHLVDSVRDLEGKGSLQPFSNTDGEKQVFRAGNTKRLMRENLPQTTPAPRFPRTIQNQHARAGGKQDPALRPQSCSLHWLPWTAAMGESRRQLGEQQAFCFRRVTLQQAETRTRFVFPGNPGLSTSATFIS